MFVEVAQTTACQDIESTGFLTRIRTVSSGLGAFVQLKRRDFTNASASRNAVVCNLAITLYQKIIIPAIWCSSTWDTEARSKWDAELVRFLRCTQHLHWVPVSLCSAAGGRHDAHGSVRDAAQRKCQLCTVRLVFWHLTAYTPNGDDDVMEAKWKSMVSSECDLNLCLLLPAYASVWERNTAGHHRLHENTALSCLLLHLLLFPDPSRGSTRWGCWRVSSTAFTI